MNHNMKPIKSLVVGDLFHLVGIETIYRVTRVRSESPRTAIAYVVDGVFGEFEFVRPSLTTAVVV